MSKYVLIPDSFKGTLSSADICRIAAEEILRLEPSAEVCAIPVAMAERVRRTPFWPPWADGASKRPAPARGESR